MVNSFSIAFLTCLFVLGWALMALSLMAIRSSTLAHSLTVARQTRVHAILFGVFGLALLVLSAGQLLQRAG